MIYDYKTALKEVVFLFLGDRNRGGTTTPPMCSLFTVHEKHEKR